MRTQGLRWGSACVLLALLVPVVAHGQLAVPPPSIAAPLPVAPVPPAGPTSPPTSGPPTGISGPASLNAGAPPAAVTALVLSTNVRRYALFVGASAGGAGRAILRYAIRDAERMDSLFSELGGVPAADSRVLRDPSPSAIDSALRSIDGEIAAAARDSQSRGGQPRPTQLLFYYSGHSDEAGLLLGDQRLPYSHLRSLLQAVHADVKIAILDSCASGAFALRKGGHSEAAFLTADPSALSGHAFLTSSSATEVAQESERVRGSFFTHYLSTGLRGAADADKNGLVTLQEAYRFAFEETLARTEATLYGAQHAAYDIQLAGVGDLVLTELRRSTAQIILPEDVRGRIYLRDTRGHLLAELDRSPSATGNPGKTTGLLQLSVPADAYRVTVDDGAQVLRGNIDARSGPVVLRTSDLHPVPKESAQRRGGEPDEPTPSRDSVLAVTQDPSYRVMPVNVGILPSLSTNALEHRRTVINYFSLSLLMGLTPRLIGVDIALFVSRIVEESLGMQASFIATYTGGSFIGMQGSFVAAVARGDLYGAQLSTVSLAFADFAGLQAGLGMGYIRGDLRGAQLSGALSLTYGRLTGVQTGVVNYAQKLVGAQIGGVNIADQATGVQLGALNISRGRMQGLQIGFINIADDLDAAIGFLTISKRGGAWLDVWTSDHAAFNLSLRLRARYTYTLLTAAVHPFGSPDNQAWMYGMGFGGHLPLFGRFALESDVSVYGVHFGFDRLQKPNLLCQWRILFFARLLPRLAVFGGPTLSTLNDFDNPTPTTRPGYGWATYRSAEQVPSLTLWPGFTAGVEF
ncbi:MAG TPA: caspase family protein [Pseudomonadota bacterium]|nr:caspase family protein [Pseudomonadota bacterium]